MKSWQKAKMTLVKRCQKQMEFYLGDSNFRKDKFLRQQVDEEGFISLNVFLSFQKYVDSFLEPRIS